jgi:hypothetical protein
MLVKLAAIETKNKQAQSTLKCMRATREAARRSGQSSQVMAQLSIVPFDRKGVGFPIRNFISTIVIPKTIISIKSVAVIASSFGSLIHHILDDLLSAFPDNFPAQIAARLPVYDREDVDPVFLSPIKVNSSSISASFTSSGRGASGNLVVWALIHKETVR